MISPSIAVLGLLTSIIAELLKLIPWLNKNAITSSLTAIIVLAIGTVVATGTFDFTTFIGGLVFALTSYKAIIQPIATVAGSPTQKSVVTTPTA